MKSNMKPTAYHKRKHDFKVNAITLELPETHKQANWQFKQANTENEKRYAEGYRHGYLDVRNNEKPLDRYELASMFYQTYASGYLQGKRDALKERRKLLQQSSGRENGNKTLSVFNTPTIPAKFKRG